MCSVRKIQTVYEYARILIFRSFHAALTAQAARFELGTLVRDLFISKIKNTTLQDTLTFETLDPEEVLKRAIHSTNVTPVHSTNELELLAVVWAGDRY